MCVFQHTPTCLWTVCRQSSQCNMNHNLKKNHTSKWFETVVHKIVIILSRPQCIKHSEGDNRNMGSQSTWHNTGCTMSIETNAFTLRKTISYHLVFSVLDRNRHFPIQPTFEIYSKYIVLFFLTPCKASPQTTYAHTSLNYYHNMTKHNKTARILHGIYSEISYSTILSDSKKTELYFTSKLNSKHMRWNTNFILSLPYLTESPGVKSPFYHCHMPLNLSQWAIRSIYLKFKRATRHDITTCVVGQKLNFLERQWYPARRLLLIFNLPTSVLQQSLLMDLLQGFMFNEYLTKSYVI